MGDAPHANDATYTRLGRAARPFARAGDPRSGVYALPDGRDAFAARALLAEAAERALDVRSYIWRADRSGTLLFDALRRAADRGVRVRLLLDDNDTTGLDAELGALDLHPNVEVRLFNPFRRRRLRWLGYLTDFARLNRRMHNKSFTADGAVTIVGGRNVGDEYFDAGAEVNFADLDVIAVGPVVDDVARDFERYWTSESSVAAARVLPAVDASSAERVASNAAAVLCDPASHAYVEALARSAFVTRIVAGELPFLRAVTHLVSDDPQKGLGRARDEALLWPNLERIAGPSVRELQLVSAYFVPGAKGLRSLAAAVARGVAVSVLTNALEATDVPIVHAGYAKRRKALLEAGVVLFEQKREYAVPKAKPRGLQGSSRTSLHAKTFAIDRERAFVGSFNFDPRSEHLNTEMGFVIESPELACTIADAFARGVPERAYEVRLDGSGSLRWIERTGGEERVHDVEPGTTFAQRLAVEAISLLPIEWLL